MSKQISSKALEAARKQAKLNRPEPAIEPAAAFFAYGIGGFCVVGAFIALDYFLPLEAAWIGAAAITACIGCWDSWAKQKAHVKEFKELLDFYKDDPRLRD